jgi:membrane fusion protein (multidrug efflux system)
MNIVPSNRLGFEPTAVDWGRGNDGEQSISKLVARNPSPDPAPATMNPAPVSKAPATPPQGAPVTGGTPASTPPRKRKGKAALAAALLVGLAAGGHYGWHWWTVGRFQESTDNAFLQADKVTIAPKVAGFISAVLVGDNQPVKAGDVVATIDDADYKIAIAEAQADLDKAVAQLDGYKAAVVQQQAQIETSRADIVNAEAALTFAQQEAGRSEDLLNRGAGTTQRAQQTRSDLLQRQATLTKNRAALYAAEKQVETFEALAKSAFAAIAGAQAKLDQAKLNLGYTTIRAPIDGVVGDRSVRTGQLVQPGVGLLTVVPMGRDIYLIANFKETQIGRMAQGQAVTFTVDAFGGHAFHGNVDSVSPGTGAQFALLPPENATGNFTKVVQRVPVKIRLAGYDPLLPRLRPGLSVEATVEMRADPAPEPRTLLGLADAR